MEIQITYLADHPQHLRQVALWNNTEWPEYYEGNLDQAILYHTATMTRKEVPCALVALAGNVLAGTVTLLKEDMNIRPNLTPWLGSLYVDSSFRGKGLARKLITACTEEAAAIGIKRLYVWTKELRSLFESEGWKFLEAVDFLGARVDILSLDFNYSSS